MNGFLCLEQEITADMFLYLRSFIRKQISETVVAAFIANLFKLLIVTTDFSARFMFLLQNCHDSCKILEQVILTMVLFLLFA